VKLAGLTTILALATAAHPADWQVIHYKSGDLTLYGVLTRPAGEGPFPVVVVNHGGYMPAIVMLPLCRQFAARGYVAAASDYRGCGFSQGKHEMAKGEVDDVLALIEHLKSLPYADTKRLVMIGESHGGAITLLAAARSKDVRAAVALCAPSDLASLCEYWKTRPLDLAAAAILKEGLAQCGGTPQQAPGEYRIRSPIGMAGDFKAPVLLVHGANDTLVPPSQSEAMFRALKAAGKGVELKIVPNCGHVIPTPLHFEDSVKWFEKALAPK